MGPRLLDLLPHAPASADDVVDAFGAWIETQGLSLYPHQEEAILEVLSGNHVILATPTGSGKSMVALAAHATSLCGGGRSWYTAPVKALVSEKFFDLCEQLGADNVGMLTGDTTINPDAPVVCCTTEILALCALRDGPALDADIVVLDEFHFYGDRDRGWAWQVPLLQLPQARFLLLSATLGDVSFFVDDLSRRTGRDVAVVDEAVRPVPLRFEYRRTLLHHTVEDLVASGQTPLYLVNFSQADAVAQANALASVVKLDDAAKAVVADELARAKLPAGFGRDLGRLLRNGVGVHHAGMLPRYRRLVERLTQRGVLKVVSGTDTLGVGVNLPIRTVVFTRLYKYDGSESRLLSAREFHQIAGRAGRAGYDTEGLVVAQAPDHVAENEQAAAKAASDPKKAKKQRKASPPKGWVHYDEETFERLRGARPERLTSSFRVTPGMLLHLLDRPGDPFALARSVLLDNHEPRSNQRRHVRRAVGLYRALRDAGVVRTLPEPDTDGRRIAVDHELQADFALNQPLAPFLLHAVPLLDGDDDGYPLAVLAVVESVLDQPFPILFAQQSKAKDEAMAAMKAAGVEYEARIEELEKIRWPQPMARELYDVFDTWRVGHRWIEDHNVAPKGVVRDAWERAMDFPDFVRHYGLKRSEGLVLRYFSDCYKTLLRSVPDDAKDDGVWEILDWLEAVIRSVDSSLVDEWQALADGVAVTPTPATADEVPVLRTDSKAFRALVRTRVFRWVQHLATGSFDALADDLAEAGDRRWSADRLRALVETYLAEHDAIGIDADARGPHRFVVTEAPGTWRVEQILADPAGHDDWYLSVEVDLAASEEVGAVAARLLGLEQR